MTHKLITAGAVLAATLPAAAAAQDVIVLDRIVASGGFTPIEAQTYGRSYSILTGEEMEQKGLRTVQEAIRTLPGVAVSQTDPYNTQVRIRGGEGNHVLVLIDGVAATAGDNGEYYFSGLQTADIERIELLRGPQSVLYGANAMTGVISIITKRAAQPGTSYEAGTVAGTDGTYGADFALRTRGAAGELNFSVQSRHDGGYDVSGDDGGDDDSSTRSTINLTGRTAFASGIEAGFTLRATTQDYDFDDTNYAATDADSYIVDTDNTGDRDELFASVWAEAEAMGGRMRNRLTFSGNDIDTKTYDPADVLTSQSDSSRRAAQARLSYALDAPALGQARHILNAVAEHEYLTFRRASGGTEYDRRMNSVALEYQGEVTDALNVQAGVRRDFNSDFEDATSWNIAASYAFASGARLHTSAGKAVVNPSMYELYGYSPGFYTGNPDLNPEESVGFDIGIELPFAGGRGLADVTYFHEDLEDEIVYTPSFTSADNLDGTSKRRGVELAASYEVTPVLDMALSYTYTDAETATGTVEVRRPEHQIGLEATLAVLDGRGSVSLALRHVAGNFDTQYWGAYATEELPDYTVATLSGHYALSDRAELVARIENLTDEDYSEVWGYEAAGRSAYLGLRARW